MYRTRQKYKYRKWGKNTESRNNQKAKMKRGGTGGIDIDKSSSPCVPGLDLMTPSRTSRKISNLDIRIKVKHCTTSDESLTHSTCMQRVPPEW